MQIRTHALKVWVLYFAETKSGSGFACFALRSPLDSPKELHLRLSRIFGGIGHMKKIAKKVYRSKQLALAQSPTYYQFNHGGVLRNKRKGRGVRPISTKDSLHVVFKVNKYRLRSRSLRSPRSFGLIQKIIAKYANRFFVKLDQVSIQNDHCHLLVRTTKRSHFHFFFRVVAGQVAQVFEKEGLLLANQILRVTDTPSNNSNYIPDSGGQGQEGAPLRKKNGTELWLYRPFSRVVRGWRAYRTARDYIQLNEKEVTGKIAYNPRRLRGLSSSDWQILWT